MIAELEDAVGGAVEVLWPAALTMAVAVVGDRVRSRRRRRRLNERLHELRRPLQALVLSHRPERCSSPDPLELALAALRDLDGEINGRPRRGRRAALDPRAVVLAAADRWRPVAARRGRGVRVSWRGPVPVARADPMIVARALDNLIANALEHGSGTVTIEGAARDGAVEIAVRNAIDAGAGVPRGGRRDPRHGHGLRLARAAALGNGGKLRMRTGRTGARAVLELPVTPARETRDPHRR